MTIVNFNNSDRRLMINNMYIKQNKAVMSREQQQSRSRR